LIKKLFLFDIDGTLLASGGAGYHALIEVTRETFGTGELAGIDIAGRTDSSIAQQLFARHGRPAAAEAVARFYEGYVAHLVRLLPITEGRLLPGVTALLDALRARPDCVLALLTGNLVRGAELKLRHYGVWHYFEFGAYADDHADRNALGPVALRRAREKHGVDFAPAHTFILGDTPHDIACARAIGARAVAIATGRHTRAELAACAPDHLFDDLADTPAVLAALGLG
jgi:phosphoglycolate phosphatase-like HAD superfamily hydrolase